MSWCAHVKLNRWGETQEQDQPLPRWIYHCRLVFGYAMKQHVTAEGRWDAFVIGNVVINHLVDFLPANLNGDDAASEHYRNCVHHVQYLRNTIAHPPAPTAAECLAGLGATIEVLKAEGQATVVTQLQPLLAQLREIATLPTGSVASIVLSSDVLPLWALEAAMQRFGDDLGPRICAHFHPASQAPTLPMNVGGDKSICTALCNGKGMDGHNPALKHWPEYWGMPKADHAGFVVAVNRTAEVRHKLNHKQHEITLADAIAGIDDMIDVETTLGLAPNELKDLQKCVNASAGAPMTVLAEVSGAMRIPFKDPRKYLVGRGPLISGIAARLRTLARHIEVLHGESGAGKTVAAIGAAYEASDALPVQLFMDGSSVARMRAELARYGRLHVGGLDVNAIDDELVEAARKQLARRTGWLLLVDDVGHDLSGVLDLLPVDDAGGHVGHVLLTSQRRGTWPTTLPLQTTEVGELLTDESMAFLGQGVDAAVLADTAIDVRGYVENELGNLALDVALLKNALKGITDVAKAAELLLRWRAAPAESLEAALDVSESQRRSLRRRIGTVRELLRRIEVSCDGDAALLPVARSLLAMCSVLDPAGVPSVLFTGGATTLKQHSPGARLFRDAQLYAAAARVLADVGLVHGDSSHVLNMHQLVQACVRHELRHGEVVGLRPWGTLFSVLRERYVAAVGEHERRKAATMLHTSAYAIYHRCDGGTELLAPLAKAELGSAIGRWYREAGGIFDWKEALPLCEHALGIHEAQLGPDHPSTASSLNDLALVHKALGQHATALPLYERALGIREAQLGPDHPDTAASLNNLAILHKKMGQQAKALPLYERALAIYEARLGADSPDTAATLSNLAVLHQAMGQHAKALPLHARALAIREAELGPEHPVTAKSSSNLAALHEAMGQHATALPLLERALGIRESQLGPDHPETATSLNNLAMLLTAMGHYATALPLHERALGIYEAKLGPVHPSTAMSLNNLAACQMKMGQHATALPLLERALGICEAQLGPEHPDTAKSLNNLASLHKAMGHYATALPLHERALAINEAQLGPDHPDTATTLINLATLHQLMSQHATALPLYERALGICEAQLGPDHPGTATGLNNLAALHDAMGHHAKALPLCERALAINEAQLGPDHPDTASSVWTVGLLHEDMCNYKMAARLFRRLLGPTIQLPSGLDRAAIHDALTDCTVRHPHGKQKSEPKANAAPKIGRNDACPCGSGKKYKKCHGK
jgi:tetratricopeptide (TPR) repeat protein